MAKPDNVLAVALFKGGVGKTTIATNLAAAFAAVGRRVLLVDTDTQGQAGIALGVAPPAGLAEIIADGADPAAVVYQARPGLDLLAGGPGLAGAQLQITRQPYGGENILAEILDPLRGRYEFVIVDTGPGFGIMAINVLFAADRLVVPVSLEALAVAGLVEFVKQLDPIQKIRGGRPFVRWIVPTALDRRVAQSAEILDQLRGAFGDLVQEPIRYNVRISEAQAHGRSIFEHDIGARGAADIAALAERILDDDR